MTEDAADADADTGVDDDGCDIDAECGAPRAFPDPGNLFPEPEAPLAEDPEAVFGTAGATPPGGNPAALAMSSSAASSSMPLALSGSSCSARNGISRPWIRRQFFSRSMQAWCRFSISRPNNKSTSRP